MRSELETLTTFMEGQLDKIKESRRQRDAEQAVIDHELGKKGKQLNQQSKKYALMRREIDQMRLELEQDYQMEKMIKLEDTVSGKKK